VIGVRAEEAADRDAVREVNLAAFGGAVEADLVEALHAAGAATVALVAEQGDRVVGHILFSPVTLVGRTVQPRLVGLAPMAVRPEEQSKGHGSALVRAGLARCAELGLAGVVVLGHARYYPRFGFRPAHELGLRSEYEVPADVFQALALRPAALRDVAGMVRYHDAFARV
jgi:putative acetyltransferase